MQLYFLGKLVHLYLIVLFDTSLVDALLILLEAKMEKYNLKKKLLKV